MPRTILKARARARAQAQTETGQSRVSRIQGGVDLPFLMLTIVLVAIGLVMLLSASYPSAYYDLRGNTGGDPLYYFKRQGVFALVGFGVMYVVSKLNYRGLKGLAMPILVVACVLMLAVHVPGLGHSSGGATRWLNFPTQWQPSEVGKIALIIFFAARLAKRDQRKPLSFRRNTAAGRFGNLLERIGFFELVPYLIVLILMIGILYLQPHMSAAIQMVVIAAAILFAGGISAGWFIGGGTVVVGALAVLIFGQWRPSRILFAAFFFGLMKTVASAYSGIPFLANLGIPNDVYKMVPYVATLIVLAFTSKNSMAPRAEGIPYDKGSR